MSLPLRAWPPRGAAALTLAALALLALLGGCAGGPDYQRPAVELPVAWKIEPPWRAGTPGDALAKGPWWLRFNDPQLDALQARAQAASPTLAIAGARLTQARANLASTSAARFPQVSLGARAQRFDISADRPLTNYASPNYSTTQNDFALSLTVNYEADLFGRIQRGIEGAAASAGQSAADFENTRLLVSTDLATAYFNLRELDVESDVLARSIALQRRAFDLIRSRHDLGAASGLEVAQQQALIDTTLTQVDVLARQRSQYEHAVATLTGTPAPLFTLAADVHEPVPPTIPVGVPSDVLERRPDVASAERAMAVANAQVGVAQAAFYPSVILGPQVGFDSRTIATLFDAPSLLWSLGVSTSQVLFDGGRLRANIAVAQAGYDGSVASYRRTVLVAMQEAEDGITGLAALERAHAQSLAASASARHVLEMATARYEGGATTYLDVITAQQSLLTTERQAAQLLGQRMVTSVFLVKALGGGWQRPADLATAAPVAGVATARP